MKNFSLLWLALFVAFAGGCETTHMTTVWKAPGPPPAAPFNKVLALVVNAPRGERRIAEDSLAEAMQVTQGVPAYQVIPDENFKDREKVRAILLKQGIDGAAVLKVVSSESDSQDVYTGASNYGGNGLYDGFEASPLYGSGYTVTNVYVHAELSIYSVASEKLLWVGSSTTKNPGGIRDLVGQVSQAAAAELRQQGLLR